MAARDVAARETLVQRTAEEIFADVAQFGVNVGTNATFVAFAENLFGLATAYQQAQAAAAELKAAAVTAQEPGPPAMPSAASQAAASL